MIQKEVSSSSLIDVRYLYFAWKYEPYCIGVEVADLFN